MGINLNKKEIKEKLDVAQEGSRERIMDLEEVVGYIKIGWKLNKELVAYLGETVVLEVDTGQYRGGYTYSGTVLRATYYKNGRIASVCVKRVGSASGKSRVSVQGWEETSERERKMIKEIIRLKSGGRYEINNSGNIQI